MLNKSIKFLIENKLVAVLLLVLFVGWGTVNAPFNWDTGFLPSNPVAIYIEKGFGTDITIREYHQDKKGKIIEVSRAYNLKENGTYKTPELAFGFRAKKEGRSMKKVNFFLTEECDDVERIKDNEIYKYSFLEAKEICEIFYHLIP